VQQFLYGCSDWHRFVGVPCNVEQDQQQSPIRNPHKFKIVSPDSRGSITGSNINRGQLRNLRRRWPSCRLSLRAG
jgi:hypothetical protein